MKLMREVRFSVCPAAGAVANSWAGWPAAARIAPFMTLQAVVRGEPDPQTGYLCNIKSIDNIMRERAIAAITERYERRTHSLTGETLIQDSWKAVRDHMPLRMQLDELRLATTPFLSFCKSSGDTQMVTVTEMFEFSAAHRLHCAAFSEAKNQEVFGKCANPNGHGHNYQLEVSVSGRPDPGTGTIIDIGRLESVVKEVVLDRFDHKHLNMDCPEFANLNPSVENIATVIWKLLNGQLQPARLTKIRVWETPKTYAEIKY